MSSADAGTYLARSFKYSARALTYILQIWHFLFARAPFAILDDIQRHKLRNVADADLRPHDVLALQSPQHRALFRSAQYHLNRTRQPSWLLREL